MRKIREVLRLRLGQRLSQRAIGQSLRLSLGAVNTYLSRTRMAGLGWPLPTELDDDRLERLLYCSYTFFEQCPHRMACARCDFYIPKPSGKAQLLEAKADVDRRLALIPLTDGERAAVEQDQQALGKLLGSLADTPTPAGPTPREIAGQPSLSACQSYST